MKLRFIEKREEVAGVYSFYFQPENELTWTAGQFLHYTLPHENADDRGIKRWFTISTAPFEKQVRITTRFNNERSSTFKSKLLQLKEGDEIEADPPEGDFVFGSLAKKYVFVAGGIGVTPYRAMLMQLDHEGKDFNVNLLYANRDDQLVFGDELEKLSQKHSAFRIFKFIGDKKIELGDLKKYMDDPSTIIYISGPEPMVEDFYKKLKNAGVPEERVKGDYFPNYPTY